MCVFDRPKTAALHWGRNGEVTEWNPTFAYATLEMGVGVELCWPYRPKEKGTVENLVGFVKSSFFKVRRFRDKEDLEQQLLEWHQEVNEERPCRATGVVPAKRLVEEAARLRPLKVRPEELALRIPVYVGPTATVLHDGHPYSMPSEAISMPGTLYLCADRVRIVAGRYEAVHPRKFIPQEGSTLAAHRVALVAAVSGKRGKRYLKRQQLLDLGEPAFRYLTEIVHRRPRQWFHDVDRLHAMLQSHGPRSSSSSYGGRTQGTGLWRSLRGTLPAARSHLSGGGPVKKANRRTDLAGVAMTGKVTPPTPQSLELSEGQLDALFKRLNLAHMRRIYQAVAAQAEKESWSYREFLVLLLAEEVARRKQTRLQRCTRSAHFPFFKTIDEFDFTLQSTLRQSLLGAYLGMDFVTEGRSLILYGKTGRGKTHLAIAIGYRAIQNGFETLFTTAAELIEDLSNASKKPRLHESLATYTRPHVLVIDEVGYLTYGPDAANVLFHVVNDRHLRKRSMLFTTNKPLSEWGKVLHVDDMAAAILDRVLERGRFLHRDGPSGRTRHLNLEEILPANADRARISGISVPEFPEPTTGQKMFPFGLACSKLSFLNTPRISGLRLGGSQ